MRTIIAVLFLSMLFLASCGVPPTVFQGTVINCDDAQKSVFVRDQERPDRTLEFSFSGAEVGTNPRPGDIIRVAYRTQDGKLKATRIMNISRQKDLKGSK